jgi:hypothetical protein
MANHSTSGLGSINTPLSPGEALARFSPLKSCGAAPLRLPRRRHASSRWRHDEGNWQPEERKAPVVTRSVSASSVPVTMIPPQSCPAEQLARDRVTGWRPTVRRQQVVEYENPSYTAEQIAGFQLYEMKSKRLSSFEYGSKMEIPIPEDRDNQLQYDSLPRQESPSARIVELEAETPAVSPITKKYATFQPQPLAASSPPKQSPLQLPLKAPRSSIIRKPVGSAPSTTIPKSIRSKSDPLLIWPLEKSRSPERPQSQSPQKQKHEYEFSSVLEPDQAFSPWDTHLSPPSPSPSLRPRGPRHGPNTKIIRPPFGSQIDMALEPGIALMEQQSKERHRDEFRWTHCRPERKRYVQISRHDITS